METEPIAFPEAVAQSRRHHSPEDFNYRLLGPRRARERANQTGKANGTVDTHDSDDDAAKTIKSIQHSEGERRIDAQQSGDTEKVEEALQIQVRQIKLASRMPHSWGGLGHFLYIFFLPSEDKIIFSSRK